jgi:hypothetical protein
MYIHNALSKKNTTNSERTLKRDGEREIDMVVVSRDGKRLEMRVLTVLTRDRFFVPGTNPLRGPPSSFVDGVCSGNLPLGQRIGDEEV